MLSAIACGGAKPLDSRTAVNLTIGTKPSENFAQFGTELESNAVEDTWSGRVGMLSIWPARDATGTLLVFDNVELHAGIDRWGHVSALIRPDMLTKAIEARDAVEKMGLQLAAKGWQNTMPLGDYWRHLLDNDCKGDHRLTHDWHMGPPGTTMPKASMRLSVECMDGIASQSRWAIMLTFASALGE